MKTVMLIVVKTVVKRVMTTKLIEDEAEVTVVELEEEVEVTTVELKEVAEGEAEEVTEEERDKKME